MFSERERLYLDLVARSSDDPETGRRALVSAFPNPAYRRKLLWGIRRKAADAAVDWQRYAAAALVEEKVLPGSKAAPPPLLVEEPLVTMLRGLQALVTRSPRRSSATTTGPRASGRRGR